MDAESAVSVSADDARRRAGAERWALGSEGGGVTVYHVTFAGLGGSPPCGARECS